MFAGGGASNVVDIFDGISESWKTDTLVSGGQPKEATSLPNQGLAIFGGGWNGAYVILVFELLILHDGVMWELGGMCCVEGSAL